MTEPAMDIQTAYDPKVRAELVEQLAAPARIWGHGDAPRMPRSYPHYERDLHEALDYTGQFLDGYVMARYLEEKRHWPADQDLVAILGMAKELLAGIVADLERKNNKNTDYFLVGDRLMDVFQVLYEIVEIEYNNEDPQMSIYHILNFNKFRRFKVTHKAILEDIQEGHYRKLQRAHK